MQYCTVCNKFIFFPREVCPYDLSPMDKLVWSRVSGRGRVYSYTTVYQSSIPSFTEDAPYVHATIQLDEGARMTGNVLVPKEQLMEDPGCLAVGQRVKAVFDDVTPDVTARQMGAYLRGRSPRAPRRRRQAAMAVRAPRPGGYGG